MAKILIVDDAAFMRRLLEQILRAAGYEVACAVDGQECLDMIEDEKPDLVIMDRNMPRMDGLEAIRALRADPATRSLPVLVASASAQDVDIAEMEAAGVNGRVSKPFQVQQLLATVRQYLE